MGFLFTLIGISAIICLLVALASYDERDKNKAPGCALGAALACVVVIGIIFFVAKLISYTNYLDMMEKQVTIEQETASVESYATNGVGVFIIGQAMGKEITDFKFGAYQEEMSRKIRYLKDMVQSYNRHVVSKKLMKSSLYWNWWIYMPDMSIQTIEMGKLLENKTEEVSSPAEESEPEPEPTVKKEGGV
jgi:amino acid transporter